MRRTHVEPQPATVEHYKRPGRLAVEVTVSRGGFTAIGVVPLRQLFADNENPVFRRIVDDHESRVRARRRRVRGR